MSNSLLGCNFLRARQWRVTNFFSVVELHLVTVKKLMFRVSQYYSCPTPFSQLEATIQTSRKIRQTTSHHTIHGSTVLSGPEYKTPVAYSFLGKK